MDYAGSGTRERVHPQRTRFGAKGTRSDERPQQLNFSSFAVVEVDNNPGLRPVMHMPRRRRKLKNPSGLTRFILFYFVSLRTYRVRLEIPTRDAKLIDEGVRGGRTAQPQLGFVGRAQYGAALLKRGLAESCDWKWAGAIPAANCFYVGVICARADRSDDAKVAAMPPRDDGNRQAIAWKTTVVVSPSNGGNPCNDAVEGRRGEGTIRAEPDVLVVSS